MLTAISKHRPAIIIITSRPVTTTQDVCSVFLGEISCELVASKVKLINTNTFLMSVWLHCRNMD